MGWSCNNAMNAQAAGGWSHLLVVHSRMSVTHTGSSRSAVSDSCQSLKSSWLILWLLVLGRRLLLQAGANLNHQDFDGWTPLHGAAHWGQEESCKLLCEANCDMDIKNKAGQTAMDVADEGLIKLLKELHEKQQSVSCLIPFLTVSRSHPHSPIPAFYTRSVTRLSIPWL